MLMRNVDCSTAECFASVDMLLYICCEFVYCSNLS